MGKIKVIRDPNIDIPQIVDLLVEPAPEDGGSVDIDNPQTHITGILAPLVKFNDVVIKSEDLLSFRLSSEGFLPECSFTFRDNIGFVSGLHKPNKNTEVQVQIIPAADNMSKKINIVFAIDNVDVFDNIVTCSCIYKVKGLYDTRLESFGCISTFELFDTISNKTRLGFASNINGIADKRWIYANGISYIDIMQRETDNGGEEMLIPMSWIDFHNYIILEDVFSRYREHDDNLKIKALTSVLQNSKGERKFVELSGITNDESYNNCSLYVKSYKMLGNNGDIIYRGDNKLIDTYIYEKRSTEQIQLVDSDFKENNSIYRYSYIGEVFGEYNMFAQQFCNSTFIKKINTNIIEVELTQPILDLERGDKVNFNWYDYNSILKSINSMNGESDNDNQDDSVLNKQVSGQYLIVATIIDFENNNGDFKWSYKIRMTKPDAK